MTWLEAIWRFLVAAREFITNIPEILFGSALESGLGITFAIYTTAVAIGFAITGFAISRELLKGLEVFFNEKWVEERNQRLPEEEQHTIDWTLARQQRVRSLCFTLPIGAMVLASLYIWVAHSFTSVTYATFAAIWFGAGLVVLRPWWVATVIWTAHVAPPKRQEKYNQPEAMTARGAFSHYMKWGLGSSSKKRRMFVRLLRPFNWLASLLGLQWLKIRLLWPLAWWMVVAIAWPIGMVIALCRMGYDFTKKGDPLLMPLWSKSRADLNEPKYTGKNWTPKKSEAPAATEVVADA